MKKYKDGELKVVREITRAQAERFIKRLIGDDALRAELQKSPGLVLQRELGVKLTRELLPARPFKLPPPEAIAEVYWATKDANLLDNPNHLFAALMVVHPA